MRKNMIAGLVAVAMLVVGASVSIAQDCPRGGCQGKGYGGPPMSEQERAARQADCLEKNGGICPNGGPRQDCPALGAGRGCGGKGAGKGGRYGLRDGTGPRAGKGMRPATPPAKQK